MSSRPLQNDEGLLKDTWGAVAALPVVAEAGTTLGTRQAGVSNAVWGFLRSLTLTFGGGWGGERIKSDVQIQLSTHVMGSQTPLCMLCLGVHPHYKIKAKYYDLLSTDGGNPS